MQVRIVGPDGGWVVPTEQLPDALADPSCLVWVDVPTCDDEARRVLREVLGFHLVAVHESAQRQHMPKVHAYRDHVFVVLHGPMRGDRGHIHYIELDQFMGQRVLVTVHGPTNPKVPAWVPLRETEAVWDRITEGRFHPTTPVELSRAIVSAMAREMEYCLDEVTTDIWELEQRVTAGELGDPEDFLERMFQVRHALLAVANMTDGGAVVCGRLLHVPLDFSRADRKLLADVVDQFQRVHRLAVGQREYLQGVIDFYRTRTDTKMTIAAERLAVIAAVTLPATALASILGMNVIVNDRTQAPALSAALGTMIVMSLFLLRWARKHGWW